MKYLSTKTYAEVEMDVATATLDEVNDAYTSLLSMSDSGGAFPGSKAWLKAKPYSDKLAALVASRPEIEEYRARRAAAKSAERLAGKDIYGM